MPCTICSAWPTWADLSECERPNCPWTLDLGLAIPPLPKSLRDAPLHQAISTPQVVKPQPPVRGPLPAVVSMESAPMHSHASMNPGPAQTVVPDTVPVPTVVPKATTVPVKAAAKVAPKARFSCRKVQDDYDNIMRAVEKNNWSGNFGPSCQVETRLKWTDPLCRELYLAVKGDLHDTTFSAGRKTLYFYIGAIGNWGKAGFRISGHTKPASSVDKSTTHGVLHIEN